MAMFNIIQRILASFLLLSRYYHCSYHISLISFRAYDIRFVSHSVYVHIHIYAKSIIPKIALFQVSELLHFPTFYVHIYIWMFDYIDIRPETSTSTSGKRRYHQHHPDSHPNHHRTLDRVGKCRFHCWRCNDCC